MRRVLLGSAAAVLLLLVFPDHASAQVPHTFYVHVTDKSGAPVPNLAPTDFGVIEGGAARKVVRATYGGAPLRILFLVDTSEGIAKMVNPVRAAEQAFIDGVPPEDEIALVSLGRQMRIRVQPTVDRKKLKDGAGQVFPDGGGTVLLDGLLEAYDRLGAKVEDRSPVIVILTTNGSESSTATREDQFNKFVNDLLARGVVVHAAIVTDASLSGVGPSSASAGLQSVIAINLTRNTKGHLDSVNTATALPEKMTDIAGLIRAQQEKMKGWYQIDYATNTVGPGQGVDVTLSHMDVKFELSDHPPR